MLKLIPPILGPDLLHILRAMGHGDEIAIVDANYPGDSAGPELVRMDGLSATDVLDAVLTLMPLDTFVDHQAFGMGSGPSAGPTEPIHGVFNEIIKRHEPEMELAYLQRFDFYDRVRNAYAVVQTGERRLYANILLKKGIIRPE